MDNALYVGGVQGAAHLADDLQGLGQRDLDVTLEAILQVLALQELHDDERQAGGVLIQIGHLDDARVAQAGDDPRLVLEALGDVLVRRRARVQDLDRAQSAGADVAGPENGAHSPRYQKLLQGEGVGEDLPDQLLCLLLLLRHRPFHQ